MKKLVSLLLLTATSNGPVLATTSSAMNDGFCLGAISMLVQRGISLSPLADKAAMQAELLYKKYQKTDRQYGEIAGACYVAGQPMQQIRDCMERKIPDKNAAQFFQGFYTARTGIALKPPQLSQHEASSLCITTN